MGNTERRELLYTFERGKTRPIKSPSFYLSLTNTSKEAFQKVFLFRFSDRV